MDQWEVSPISGTEGARALIFSPNGNWIGFAANNEVKKVSISGGAAQIIKGNFESGAYWKPDNTVGSMYDLKIGLATVEDITDTLNSGQSIWQRIESEFQNAQLLPGGKTLLLTLRGRVGNMEAGVLSIESGKYKWLIEKCANARYIPTGHLVYTWAGEILAAPFDLKTLTLTGPSVTVVENIGVKSNGVVNFSISENGTMVYARGRGGSCRNELRLDKSKGSD